MKLDGILIGNFIFVFIVSSKSSLLYSVITTSVTLPMYVIKHSLKLLNISNRKVTRENCKTFTFNFQYTQVFKVMLYI